MTGGRRAAGPPEPAPTGAGDASPPEVDGRPAVVAHYGQRVRLRGRYESRPLADVRGRVWTHGPFLILDDGALILLEPRERPAAEIAAHEGRSVEITGVLVAPPVPSFDVPSVNVESLRPRE